MFINSDEYDEEDIPTINDATAESLGLSKKEMVEAVRELVEVFGYAKYGSKSKDTFYKKW